MKEGAHLVNIARGAIVETDALVEALEEVPEALRRRRSREPGELIRGRPIRDDYVMVADGEIQSGSYKAIYG